VAAVFEILGAARLDFDLFAREAVAPGGAAYGAAQEIFGPKCLLPDGTLDRAYVGRLAFKDPALRRRLEEAVHPETWRLMLLRLSEPNPRPVTVIEIPLLFEARLDPLFDRVLLTFASPDNQLRRLMFRDPKLRKSQAKRMIASQMPILEKLRRAKMVINNDGPLSRAIYQAKDLWDRLTAPPEAPPGATP
jgi:dephospho-CoA kinase